MNWLKYLFSPRTVAGMFTLYGGGDAPAPQTSTTTVQNTYSPEETARRNKVFDAAERAYAGTNYSSIMNPMPKPVGPSADTLTAQNMVREAALGSGLNLAKAGMNATQFGLSGDVLKPGSNPGLQASIDSATRKIGEQYTAPGGVISNIRSNFMNSSPSGQSSREAIAMGLAGRSYLNTIGDVTASMTSDAYNRGLDYMKSSMAFSPQMYNLLMQPGLSVGAVGTQTEGYQAAENAYNAGSDLWNVNKQWAALGPYASIVTGMSNPSSVTTASAPGPQSPGAMGVLGGALAGAQMGSYFGMPMAGAGVGAIAALFS